MIDRMRKFVVDESLLAIPLLLLAPLLCALLLTGGGFFIGKVCSPWMLRAIWIFEFLSVLFLSWRQGLKLLAAWCVISIATALTFSYVGTDALAYHFPTQDLLINGWNPVFDSSLERFDKVVGGLGLSRYHTLFLPKVNALCGALVALALNIYSGDAFLNYVLLICLFSITYRFAIVYWNLRSSYALMFAVICTFSTKVTSFLAGQVDYVAYASLCIAIFSTALWLRGFKLHELVLLVMSLIICMLSKSTGLVCGGLLLSIILVFAWRRQSVWVATACVGIAVLIIGASPLLTAWIQYGSPVYPNMTFDPTVMPVDITSDFTSNADGDRMGYLARISYAWLSPCLTEKICSIVYNKPDFHPEFYVCGGVRGLGMWFNVLLIISLLAFAFSRKNIVLAIAAFVFLTGNLAPIKYIGYNRYFPQMWIIPALGIFNILAVPKEYRYVWINRVMPYITKVLVGGLFLLSLLSVLRIAAYSIRLAAIENLRREALREMRVKSLEWQAPEDDFLGYSLTKRINQSGLCFVEDGAAPKAYIDYQFLVVSDAPARERIEAVIGKYPLCNSPMMLLRFPWLSGACEALKSRPLFR